MMVVVVVVAVRNGCGCGRRVVVVGGVGPG